MDDPTYIAVTYIGRKAIYTENLTGARYSFTKNVPIEIPPEHAKLLQKHSDVFASASDYDYVKATRNGDGGIAKGIAPSGTVDAAGTITLGTALPAVFSQILLYLPAGAISGGAAGFYAVEMSSTTVGVVRSDFGRTALTGSGSAYTGVTTEQTLASYTIPGGSLSKLRLEALMAQSNSAGTKTVKAKYGAGQMLNSPATTTPEQTFALHLMRVGSGVQHSANAAAAGGTSLAAWLTTDDSIDQQLIVTGQLAVATDYLICVASNLIKLG